MDKFSVRFLGIVALGIAFVLLSSVAALCPPASEPCPIHDSATTYYTGQQKFQSGHNWYLFHCSYGRNFWVRCD